ncbi:unnamed protein product, partial [Amoebophrya sp. A25]
FSNDVDITVPQTCASAASCPCRSFLESQGGIDLKRESEGQNGGQITRGLTPEVIESLSCCKGPFFAHLGAIRDRYKHRENRLSGTEIAQAIASSTALKIEQEAKR